MKRSSTRLAALALACCLLVGGTADGFCWNDGRAAHDQSFGANFALAAGAQIDTAGNILDNIEAYNGGAPVRHRHSRHGRPAMARLSSCSLRAKIEIC